MASDSDPSRIDHAPREPEGSSGPGGDRDGASGPGGPAVDGPGRPGSSPAILLLGHGSHLDGRSSESVHHLARELRATGRHPEVRVAFWKEEPQLRHAFLLVESPRVVAVPFFSSEGYFTDRVLPRELRIEPPVSEVGRVAKPAGDPGGGAAEPSDETPDNTADETADDVPDEMADEVDDPVRVHYTRAVGAHPAMGDAVLARALERLHQEDLLDPDGGPTGDVTLVVLGHGTERHPASGEVVEEITGRLGRTSSFQHVTCCFLDQDPRMLPVLESVETPRAVMVPYFMAEGWHVGQTIPRDLKLEEGRSRVGSTEVLFTGPVGTHPAVVRVVEQMVAEAVEGDEVEDGERGDGGVAEVAEDERGEDVAGAEVVEDRRVGGASPSLPSLPARARDAFVAWVDEGGDDGRVFLQTRVRPWREPESESSGPGSLYEIRHRADGDAAPEDLERSSDPEWARTLARRTGEGEHRPLKTAPDLRRGWVLHGLNGRGVWEAYAHLYPVAPVHWYLGRRDALPAIPFRETAERQTGIYRVVAELDDADVVETRSRTCEDGCLRRVRWPLEGGEGSGASGPEGGAGSPETGGEAGDPEPRSAEVGPEDGVPCPEACSLFVSHARESVAGDGGH